jgi:hypothetical protein
MKIIKNMKKYLIISGICTIPFMLIGMVLPALFIIKHINFNEKVFWIYFFIEILSLSIILSVQLMLLKYTDKIDKLDEEIKNTLKEKQNYIKLQEKFNQLIIDIKK